MYHPQAREEYAAAVQYYANLREELGEQLHAEVQRVLDTIAGDPQRYPSIRAQVRRAFTRRFPYAIVYADLPDTVWIVAVMHCKRLPDYWKNRLSGEPDR